MNCEIKSAGSDSGTNLIPNGLTLGAFCGSKLEAIRFLRQLENRMPDAVSEVSKDVSQIVARVAAEGLPAVLELRRKFENIEADQPLEILDLAQLMTQKNSFGGGSSEISAEVENALKLSIERVRRYHDIQKDDTRYLKQHDGSWFGSRVRPLDSVALYVPGGAAFYPSSLIMSAVPAQVAGVSRIAVFTPARSLSNPVFLKTAALLGIKQVYAVGGAQAVALAAYGAEGIARFDKIVGPGNIYVATAKKLLSGRIGIDGFAGPSEVLVLGDGSSDPDWVAADLLAQAEHDPEASAVLCTTCAVEAKAVMQSLIKLLPLLGEREAIAKQSLARWGAIVVVSNRVELVEVANAIATEHLHIQTKCALSSEGQNYWTENIKSAGAIFFGKYCAEAFGDYLAGPSHVLPTAGTARFSSPLGVYDFVKRTSLLYMDNLGASDLSRATQVFAEAEGLPAHALAAKLRKIAESEVT